MTRLLNLRSSLESELKQLYSTQNKESETRIIKEMRENLNIFFNYTRARQKTKAQVGPLLDPASGKLNPDPRFTAEALSDQYSNVFTQPRRD